MKTGILIGYFAKRDESREAFRKLRRKGYRRAAWVSKGADGEVRTWDPFHWRRVFGAAVAFTLFGAFAAVGSMNLRWPGPISSGMRSTLFPALAGGFIGTLLSVAWIRRSRFGVERRLLEDHARWLVSGETVLILQAPIETLRIPVALLLESGEIPPAVFVLHPKRESPIGEEWSPGAPLTPAQIQEHAQRLATDHQVDPKPLRDTELLKRLERGRRWVQQACLDLSEASRLQQSVPPTAEWLLDNEYILESNARDVRLNLPRQLLPATAGARERALPGSAAHLRPGAGTCLPHRPAPGPGEHPGLHRGLSIREAALDWRTLGRPPDAAHGADRGHPATRRPGPDRTA